MPNAMRPQPQTMEAKQSATRITCGRMNGQTLFDWRPRLLVTTKLWVPADDDVSRQWQRLSIGSFLLGAGKGSYHAFTSSRTSAGATSSSDSYRLPEAIGSPTGEMVTWQGLYARTFTGGLARW